LSQLLHPGHEPLRAGAQPRGAWDSHQATQAVFHCMYCPATTSLHDLQASFAPRRVVSLVLLPDLRKSHGARSATRTSLETDLLGMHAAMQAGLGAHLLQARHKPGCGTYPPAPDLPRFESCLAPAPSSFQPCRACPSTDGAEPASNTPPNSMCTLLLDHMGNFGVRNNQVNTVELSVPRHLQASQNPVESAQEPGARRAPSYFGTLIGRPITVVMGTGCGSTPICPNRPAGPRRARKRRPTTYPAAWLHRRHVAVNTFTAETAVPSPYTSGTTKPAAFFVKRWNCIRVGMPQQAHSSHCGTCLKPTAR